MALTPVKRITQYPAAPAPLLTHVIPAVDPAQPVSLRNQKLTLAQIAQLVIGQLPSIYASNYGVAVGNSAADNTTGLNAAIFAAALNGGARVMLPRGVCDFNALDPPAFNNVIITGQGRFGGSTMRFMNATGDCIPLTTWGHLGVEDVYITAGVRRTSGWAIRVYGGAFTPKINNVRIDYHYNGIHIENAGEAIVENISYRYMYGPRETQIGGVSNGVYRTTLRDQRADNPPPAGTYGPVKTHADSTLYNYGDIIKVNGKVWQQTANPSGTSGVGTAPNAIPGTGAADGFTTQVVDGFARWQFMYHESLIHVLIDSYGYSTFAEGIVGLNGLACVYVADGLATGSSHPIWQWFNDIEGDHNYGDTVVLSAGEGFRAFNSWFGSSLQGNGITIGPLYKGEVLVESTRILGMWLHGVLWYNGPCAVHITDSDIGHNSLIGDGICHGVFVVGGVTQGSITDSIIGPLAIAGWLAAPNRQGYAIYLDSGGGGTTGLIISLNDLRGNFTGPLQNLTGNNDNIIKHNQGLLDTGEMVLLDDIDLDGLTFAELLKFDPTKYCRYRLDFENIRSDISGGYFILRTSQTGGAPYDSGATDYTSENWRFDSGNYPLSELSDWNEGYICIHAQPTPINTPQFGHLDIFSPDDSEYTKIHGLITFWDTSRSRMGTTPVAIWRNAAAPVNAMLLTWYGGTREFLPGSRVRFWGITR